MGKHVFVFIQSAIIQTSNQKDFFLRKGKKSFLNQNLKVKK